LDNREARVSAILKCATKAAAVIVGIDAYQNEPLTSAVRDALAFRKALIDFDLTPAEEIRLLTSPKVTEALGEADSNSILRALQDFYFRGDEINGFFFYFAGHGILAYSNAAKTLARTALIPVDVRDLRADGKLLIDFDELRQILEQTGPEEQLYFLDACRDMPYERHPNVTELGWSGVEFGRKRRQGCIYAVSPGGQAKSARGGMGQFTSHLLEGLGGEGIALDFDPSTNKWVITM
jgi:uncharacterized caspase-like protein